MIVRPVNRRIRLIAGQVLLAVFLSGSGAGVIAQSGGKVSQFYEDALQRFEKSDYRGAIIQLKNAVQIDKNSLPVQLLLGRALLKNSEVAAAEVALTEALQLGVNRAEVAVLLAQAFLAQGKPSSVIDDPALRLAGLPPSVQVQLLLRRAEAQAALGNTREALKSVEDSRAIDNRTPEGWLAEIPIRLRTRAFKEAMEAADRALALAPSSAEAIYQKGSIQHVQGDLRAALASYERVLALEKDHVESRVAKIGVLTDLGRFPDAAREIGELRKLAPGDPRGAYLLAVHRERERDSKGTTDALKEVTQLIDPVPVAYVRYQPQTLMLNGLAHFGLGQNEKAKQYLEMFQRVQPFSAASKLLARIYLSDKSPGQAATLLEGYLRVQPGDGQALNLLASAYMALGRHAKATSLMQQALKSGDNPAFRTALGLSLVRGGNTTAGVAELEASYRRDPAQVQAATTLIRLHLRDNRTDKAVPLAEALVKRQPAVPGFQVLLGMALAQSGKPAAARSAFDKALQLDPKFTEAKLNLARLDLAARAVPAAKERLQDILRQEANNTEAMLALSRIAESENQPAEAQRWLERAREIAGPKDLAPGIQLSQFHLRRGQSTMALDAAKSALGKASEDIGTLLNYAQMLVATADLATARSTLTSASRLAEQDTDLLLEVANLQIAARDLGGAAYSLDKALVSQPNRLSARVMMAEVETRQGDLAKAEKRAQEIIALAPRQAVGHMLLGDIALAKGKPAEALDAFRRAHQVAPSTMTLMRQFDTLSRQGNPRGAQQLADQWIASHPNDLVVRKAIASAHARAGRLREAKVHYEAGLAQSPDDALILNELANVQFGLKDPAAQKTAEMAVLKSSSSAVAIDTLGWILLHNGQTDKALQLLRDARLRMPEHPEIRYHLGVALAQTGRKAEAREELEAALKPGIEFAGSAEAQKLLNSLR